MFSPVEIILTLEQLEERVIYWQKLLRLQDWIIKVEIARGYDMGNSVGKCIPVLLNKQAIIKILEPNDRAPGYMIPYDMEATLVHELLHLHLLPLTEEQDVNRDEEQAIESITSGLIRLERNRQQGG